MKADVASEGLTERRFARLEELVVKDRARLSVAEALQLVVFARRTDDALREIEEAARLGLTTGVIDSAEIRNIARAARLR